MITVLLSVTLLVLMAMLAAAWMLFPERPALAMRMALANKRYAHRGLYDNKGGSPENSLKSFRDAMDAGYGIELDLRLSADGRVVVFHDADLRRMCGVQCELASKTMDELASLRLLDTDERIPRLDEVLRLVSGSVPLLIELKTARPGGPEAAWLCSRAAEFLDGYAGPYVIESFDYAVLEWFRANRLGVMRGQLAMGPRCYAPAMGKDAAAAIPAFRRAMLSWLLYNHRGRPHFISYRFQDAGLSVRLCRALGAMCAAWTVRSPDEQRSLAGDWDAIIFEGFNA